MSQKSKIDLEAIAKQVIGEVKQLEDQRAKHREMINDHLNKVQTALRSKSKKEIRLWLYEYKKLVKGIAREVNPKMLLGFTEWELAETYPEMKFLIGDASYLSKLVDMWDGIYYDGNTEWFKAVLPFYHRILVEYYSSFFERYGEGRYLIRFKKWGKAQSMYDQYDYLTLNKGLEHMAEFLDERAFQEVHECRDYKWEWEIGTHHYQKLQHEVLRLTNIKRPDPLKRFCKNLREAYNPYTFLDGIDDLRTILKEMKDHGATKEEQEGRNQSEEKSS